MEHVPRAASDNRHATTFPDRDRVKQMNRLQVLTGRWPAAGVDRVEIFASHEPIKARELDGDRFLGRGFFPGGAGRCDNFAPRSRALRFGPVAIRTKESDRAKSTVKLLPGLRGWDDFMALVIGFEPSQTFCVGKRRSASRNAHPRW